MTQIFAYVPHVNGVVDDVGQELLVAAKKIDPNAAIAAVVTGNGDTLDTACTEISSFYEEVWKLNHPILSYPNAEVIRKLLVDILPLNSIFLMPQCTFSMDLAPGLSVKLNSGFVPDVIDVESIVGNNIEIIRQEFGGMVYVKLNCNIEKGIVLALRPGCFQPIDFVRCTGSVIDKSSEIKDFPSERSFIEIVEAEAGDVDITKSDVLVSIGRGIEDEDNIEIAQELADALGAVVSCSRPIVDAKWMSKSRQVGTSGQTVKPKVYIACGISGSFQHLGGIKGSPFIVAINKNKKAPIFQVADIGVEADILDLIPELTEAINNE